MRLFKRNKPDDVSSDVQEYYQTEKQGRVGVAWMLGLATLLTTLVITIGLFYGGRWAYRSTFGKNKNITAVNQPTNVDNAPDADNKTTKPAPATTVTPSPKPNTNANTSQGVSTKKTTPATGPLPSTGPDLPL